MKLYIVLSITYWNTTYMPTTAAYWDNVNGRGLERHDISYEEAYKMQWAIMKAGGVREVTVNPYDPSIVTVDVYWYIV